MQEHPNEARIQGGTAAASIPQRSKQLSAHPGPAAQPPAISGRVKLVSSLVLIALLGTILLTLSLWLGGVRLPFLTTIPQQPSLSLSSGPYRVGSMITLRGGHFSRYAIIALLLDEQPIVDANGLRQAADTDDQGTFSITLIITPAWSLGDHLLGAKDTANARETLIDIFIDQSSG